MKKAWAIIASLFCMGVMAYAGPTNFQHGIVVDATNAAERPAQLTLQFDAAGMTLQTGNSMMVWNTLGASFRATGTTLNLGGVGLTMSNGTMSNVFNTLGFLQRNASLTMSANTNGIIVYGTTVTLTMAGGVGLLDTVTMPLYGPKQRHILSAVVTTGAVGLKTEASWVLPFSGTVTDVRFYAQTQPTTLPLTLNVLMDGIALYAGATPGATARPTILASTSSSVAGTLTTSAVTLNALLQITVEVQDTGVTAKNIVAAITIEEDRLIKIQTDLASVLIGKAATMSDIRAYAGTVPTGTGLTLRVNVNGTAQGTLTVATSASVSNTLTSGVAVAEGDRVSIDVIGIGSTVAGGNVMVTYTLRRVNF